MNALGHYHKRMVKNKGRKEGREERIGRLLRLNEKGGSMIGRKGENDERRGRLSLT